jgi:hypothetical protein
MKVTVKKQEDKLTFENIEAREALVGDMLAAQRISGEGEGPAFNAALMAQICTFDGKQLTFEDLHKMQASDFLSLQLELTNQGAMGSKELLSFLAEKLGLLPKQASNSPSENLSDGSKN